MALREKNSW